MPPELLAFLGGVTLGDVLVWGTVAASVFAVFRWLIPFARKLVHFLDDVAGEDARPGVAARPGLMERLSIVEEKQDEQSVSMAKQSAALAVVQHEVTTNHGSSLKDAVKKLERKFDEHLEAKE